MNAAQWDAPQAAMPLALATPGIPVRFVEASGAREFQSRLAAMGLVPGSIIEVISGSVCGPLLVRVDAARIVLGRGMAHKIMVSVR